MFMNLLKHIILVVSICFFCNVLYALESTYPWKFPKDHGSHETFSTEWWYFTGHLSLDEQYLYGFELTFFRVSPPNLQFNQTDWKTKNLFFAHFALTNEGSETFEFFERINRSSFKMAGVSTSNFHVWNGDWFVKANDQQLQLYTKVEDITLNLTLNMNSPIILHGNQGYSVKNAESSQFSYYYSMPRLLGQGSLVLNGSDEKNVDASVWFDHEFFDSSFDTTGASPQQQSVGNNYVGWDWFALQLDSGDNVMIAQVRHKDKSSQHFYFGTWSNQNGDSFYLDESMIEVDVRDVWKSNTSNVAYPSLWTIRVPSFNLEVDVKPTLANQELVLTHFGELNYWEGRSMVSGTHSGKAYVELVGYD